MISQVDDKDGNHRHSDFSIEHILNRAGNSRYTKKYESNINNSSLDEMTALDTFPWLQCTRYCPPKIPRIHKKDGPPKRQPGRHPRIPFTSHQLLVLEKKFQKSPYLSSEEVADLSRELQLADIRVKIWFQNRRARERRERNEPSTSTLTASKADETKVLHSPERPLDFSSPLKNSQTGCKPRSITTGNVSFSAPGYSQSSEAKHL